MDKHPAVPTQNHCSDTETECRIPKNPSIESKCLECHVFENKCFENHLMATFEYAPIGIAHAGLDGRFLIVNRKLCNLIGYSRDELMTMSFRDIKHAEDLPTDVRLKERMMAGEIESDSNEKRYLHKNGRCVWVNRTVSLLRDEFENPLYFIVMVEDITKRKKEELERRRLASIVERSPDFIGMAAIDGKVNFINTAGQGLVGIDGMEAIQRSTILDYFPPQERGHVQNEIIPIVLNEGHWSGEIHLRHFKTDNSIAVYSDIFLIDDPDTGLPVSLATVTRDISARITTEQQLIQANNQLQALYDASPDMIFVHAEDGLLIDVNKNTLKAYGYTHEEMLALPFELFCGKGFTMEMAAQRIAQARADGAVDFEWMACRKNGEEFPVEVRLRRLQTAQETNYGNIVAIVRDISERQQAEQTKLAYLRRLEAMNKIAKAIESTLDFSTMLQKAIDGILKIFQSDRAWLAFPCDPNVSSWNVPIESASNEYPGVSADGSDIPMDFTAAEVFQTALTSKTPVIYDTDSPIPGDADWQKKYAIKTQIVIALHPKIGSPWLLGLHHCSSDRSWTAEEQELFEEIGHRITDALNNTLLYQDLKTAYKQLSDTQTQLLQSEKMASIGQLAAGVAHEINNPVGYVSSNISSMQDYLDDLMQVLDAYKKMEEFLPQDHPALQQMRDVTQRVDLDYIKQDIRALIKESKEGVTRVKHIVQDLKDFSRTDRIDWQWSDLHTGLESTLNIVWNELKYKAEVIKDYGTLPEIECVPSQLNQVFLNLLVNAAHAIETRGTITIRSGVKDNEWVWVDVADTGKGIEPDNLLKIFDPFFTTKPVGQGTGLGLSLSLNIISKHKGQIKVRSEPGNGAVFTVWLPVSQKNSGTDEVSHQIESTVANI